MPDALEPDFAADLPDADRRHFLKLGAGLAFAGASAVALPAWGEAAAAPDMEPLIYGGARLALLLGNRNYPPPFDLPPIPKNVHDLSGALQARGFEVSDGLDLDPAATRQMLASFTERVKAAPADAIVFFYFSGHGVQVESTNLLIGSGVNPSAGTDTITKGSLQLLQDVVGKLPDRPAGMTIAVVDACRTTLNALSGDDGLNQVEAPPGCLIAFSTGAGRPAIAPAVETINTFYTGSLVKLMNSLTGEVTFSDLFRLVKTDVEQTMANHPVAAIRKLAQNPFIAENTKVRVELSKAPRPGEHAASEAAPDAAQEEADWHKLEATTWPADILQQADAFLTTYPTGRFRASVRVAHDGAQDAVKALQRPDVRLYKSAFQLPAQASADQQRDLRKASRGDKDAAARLGRLSLSEGGGPTAVSRYEGWLQFATAQGNGIAAYELALHYRSTEQPLLAAQFEARARGLGYNPPPTLDNVRK